MHNTHQNFPQSRLSIGINQRCLADFHEAITNNTYWRLGPLHIDLKLNQQIILSIVPGFAVDIGHMGVMPLFLY